MSMKELLVRSGGACEFCGAQSDLACEPVPPAGDIVLCVICRSDQDAPSGHWRCLEGAAWSDVDAVQLAVWRKLATLDDGWAAEARASMVLHEQVQAWTELAAPVSHRDSDGAILAQGDTVVLIKALPVKGAGFTAKRGTAVRGISLVADNAGHIEGRVEGQRIVILTEFVKKK